MNQKQKSCRRMIILTMSLWLMLPFGACSTLNSDTRENVVSPVDKNNLLDDSEIQQCLSSIRPHENPEHYYRRGRYMQDRNKHRLAIQEFKSAIAVKPDYIEAYNALGISYDITGDYSSAEKVYNEALLLDPERADILNNLGCSDLLRKNHDKAIACFEKAVYLDGDNLRYHNNLALAYAENGQFEQALASFRKTTDGVDAHVKLAGVLRQSGHERAADQHLYLASALKEGDHKTDRLLEQPIPSMRADAVVEEDIRKEDKVVDSIEETKTDRIIAPVVASAAGVKAGASPLPKPDLEFSESTVIPGDILEEDLIASLETDAAPDPAASDPVALQPADEIEAAEITITKTPATVPEIEPAVSPEPEVAAEPAEKTGNETPVEGGMKKAASGEPASARAASTTKAAVASPDSTTDVPLVAAALPAASTAAGSEIAAESIDEVTAGEPEAGDGNVAVEIVSMEGLESVIGTIENKLDQSSIRINVVQATGETEPVYPPETTVYYCEGYLQEAWEVAKAIPGWQNMEKVPSMTPSDIKVRAVLWQETDSDAETNETKQQNISEVDEEIEEVVF